MLMLPVTLGVLSAISWGAADFNGGLAVKRSNPFGVVALAHMLSLGLLLLLVALMGEGIPPGRDWLWGGAAGLSGCIGLLFLYRALAQGRMSVAAPVSAVVAAGLSVLMSALVEGMPGGWIVPGIALGLASVWLVSGGEGITVRFAELKLPLIAGTSFGVFFICLNLASQTSLLWPLAIMRMVSIPAMFGYAILTRQDWKPAPESWMPIVLSSVLDTIGNACFALSARTGRLDVSAVVCSLYPGGTVLLAWLWLKERISRVQLLGILLALVAIVLFTL